MNEKPKLEQKTGQNGRFAHEKEALRAWGEWLFGRIRRYGAQSREKKTERFLRGLWLAAFAFLLGTCELPFSVYPLGIALLCSATDSLPYIAAGITAAGVAAQLPPWLFPCTCVLTLGVRLLARVFVDLPDRLGDTEGALPLHEHLRGPIYAESLYLRMTASCVSVFFVSLVAIIGGGFRYYDLFGALLAILLAPLAVLLYSGLFPSDNTSSRLSAFAKVTAPVALSASVCLSLRVRPLGEFLSLIAAYLAILALCRKGNLFAALAGALFCGACIGTPYIPVLLASCLVAHCLMDKLPPMAAASAAATGTLAAFLVGGSTLAYTVFSPFLVGTTLFFGYLRVKKPTQQPKDIPKSSKTNASSLSPTLRALSELAAGQGVDGFATEYAELADLLDGAHARETEKSTPNDPLSKALRERLCTKGFSPRTVSVLGVRGKRVSLLLHTPVDAKTESYLLELARKCVGVPLLQTAARETDGGVLLEYRETAAYRASAEFAFSAAEGVCGDAICTFRSAEDAKFYALICDGMGAGKKAAVVSRRAAAFLKKLLSAGAEEITALRMLNTFLRLGQAEEMTTTADLLVIDEYTGKGDFFKCGAAPGYIKHEGEVSTVSADTVPLGILQETDVRQSTFHFGADDIAVLCSDGIGDGEVCPWLTDYLQITQDIKTRDMAKHIVSTAREKGSRDDLSALVVSIKKHSA